MRLFCERFLISISPRWNLKLKRENLEIYYPYLTIFLSFGFCFALIKKTSVFGLNIHLCTYIYVGYISILNEK